MQTPILSVHGLTTTFRTPEGEFNAVNDVSFEVGPGRILALVGESGSGKSVTGLSIMRLLEPPGRVTAGRVVFDGKSLLDLPIDAMRRLRGAEIAMIFQDPMMTLNPVLRIETQLVETVLAHRDVSRAEAWRCARDVLGQVGIPSPEERMKAYPHQFSGGMRQRVVIATAMLHQPKLIIADEATTALDVTIQGQILAEMQKLCAQRSTALIWITHDLSVIAGLAHEICVMYAGRIVERGTVDDVLDRSVHPYTRGLMDSVPSRNKRGQPLRQIQGTTPSPLKLPSGCAFRTRCHAADNACLTQPEETGQGHTVRCFHAHRQEASHEVV
jgi:peptide/nickel transport system ATP-binding protein